MFVDEGFDLPTYVSVSGMHDNKKTQKSITVYGVLLRSKIEEARKWLAWKMW